MITVTDLIEIQYEIAMAIGSNLDLRRMLRASLSVILKKLGCPVGGVLLINDHNKEHIILKPVMSIPLHAERLKDVEEALSVINLKHTITEYNSYEATLPKKVQLSSDKFVHFLRLPDTGILYLISSEDYLTKDLLLHFTPLMNKLSVSIKACLQNEEISNYSKTILEQNQIIQEQYNELKTTLLSLKETQNQLIHAEKMASLGILTSGVAHEINNPLNFISGSAQGLESYFNGDENITREHIDFFLSSIKEGLNRISEIVKGLNLFSLESDELNEDCNIHEIIDKCLIVLQSAFKHRLSIIKNYCDSPITVKGNTGQLHQVFMNILSNASQAIEDYGQIKIITKFEEDSVLITIIDNGCGISEGDKNKIFTPFFTTKDPGIGTGLGLSISASIIKLHNGSIKIESEQNAGTTVQIILPSKNMNK